MNARVRSILEHILEDAQDAISFAEKAGRFDVFVSDKMTRKAIVMSILNIGELSKHLPLEYKLENDQIPWKNISGMRDIAAHGYHIMDHKIIWSVVENSLPPLVTFLKQQLN